MTLPKWSWLVMPYMFSTTTCLSSDCSRKTKSALYFPTSRSVASCSRSSPRALPRSSAFFASHGVKSFRSFVEAGNTDFDAILVYDVSWWGALSGSGRERLVRVRLQGRRYRGALLRRTVRERRQPRLDDREGRRVRPLGRCGHGQCTRTIGNAVWRTCTSGYVRSLLGNPAITRYLKRHHRKIRQEFQNILDATAPGTQASE